MNLQYKHAVFETKFNYKIGEVTYQVTSFFDSKSLPLKEKLKGLIAEDIKNHSNRTFVDGQEDNVK